MGQLNLFTEYNSHQRDEKLSQAANSLLEALNDGQKEKYEPHYYFQERDLIVIMAVNKHKDSQFNILDKDGKIPEGFDACWRNLQLIKQDLNEYNKKYETIIKQ